jgi:hypothetical protein
MLLVDHRLHRYGLTNIQSHAGSYCCCIQLLLPFLNTGPGHTLGGYNRTVAEDYLVSALLHCLIWRRISRSNCRSARFGSNRTWLKCFWNHDLLLWKGEDDDHEEKWDVLKII